MDIGIEPEALGSVDFRTDYNLRYAYASGGMYRAIASQEMVVRMGKAGLLSFFGSGGLTVPVVENAIIYIQHALDKGESYGINVVYNADLRLESSLFDLFMHYGVRCVEASAYLQITPSLVMYRTKGLTRDASGRIIAPNKIFAKTSRPEIAQSFMSPPPDHIVFELLKENKITNEEAQLSKYIPLAQDVCAEADSGGHTDHSAAFTLIPSMIRTRDFLMKKFDYSKMIRIGAAGGIGTPESAAAAFMLGADFIVTGSINQCTVESGISDSAKDLLEKMNVQDTGYAPAGDMFELGSRVQVLKKGVRFPARANKLYGLYRHYKSIDDLDGATRALIQDKYLKRTFAEVFDECKCFYSPEEIADAEVSPKRKMAMIFKWYFGHSSRIALEGDRTDIENYQVNCGPALGAFNQWVRGTELETWRKRHVDEIAIKLIKETAGYLNKRISLFSNSNRSPE